MAVEATPVETADHQRLVKFMTSSEWPYHAGGQRTHDEYRSVVDGWLQSSGTELWWLHVDDATCGLLRIFDIDDGTPLFDLRIQGSHRGRGIGTAAVHWVTHHVFDEHQTVARFEATTRVDNEAMRRALHRNRWVKESHWRSAWPTSTGEMVDGVGYGILRSDWSSGTTTPVAWDS